MKHPVLLCYNIKGERAGHINQIAMRHGIRIRHVEKEDFEQTIASLIGMEETTNTIYQSEGFDREMLVIANFPSAMINSFLNSFHEAKIPAVRLKCVLTENNSKWTSLHLYEELLQEEIYFTSIRLETEKRKKEGKANTSPKEK